MSESTAEARLEVEAAREPLRLALDDESEAVNTAAALNLLVVDHGRDANVMKSLSAWLVKPAAR